ncbi:hypothetical protein FHW19_004487 [Ochrobactrum anthropi]|uniref:hypothetical protein n=1 Tax=Brucella anthropi TaxID=529 RepID=UPI0015FD246D|nr:hypothetical protein [Brucella anthropi]MBA8862736.1 hypothetical protein [Brucella anthropi]
MIYRFYSFLAAGAFLAVANTGQPAHASDWGCKVLLCLANPGSPTEYAECVPPIEKLYSHLAKGGSFPTCSGAGFSSSEPRYDPYECEPGYNLVRSSDASDKDRLTCKSTTFTRLPARECVHNKDEQPRGTLQKIDGKLVCGMYAQKAPTKREKPHYVDVTIEGSGSRRVWY